MKATIDTILKTITIDGDCMLSELVKLSEALPDYRLIMPTVNITPYIPTIPIYVQPYVAPYNPMYPPYGTFCCIDNKIN